MEENTTSQTIDADGKSLLVMQHPSHRSKLIPQSQESLKFWAGQIRWESKAHNNHQVSGHDRLVRHYGPNMVPDRDGIDSVSDGNDPIRRVQALHNCTLVLPRSRKRPDKR